MRRMKSLVVMAVAFVIFLSGSACWAFQSALITGIRQGAALGIMFESGRNQKPQLRLGFESDVPATISSIVFIGGKWFLGYQGKNSPVYFSLGLAGFLGADPQVGPYVSYIYDRFLDVEPLFLEFGVDLVSTVVLQFRAGYYL